MNSIEIKTADTSEGVHPLIKKRWSPLSFSDQLISEEKIQELFEASRWAASAYNEQPWEYVYAHRGTKGFEDLWNCLMGGNQPWTQKAAVLMVAIARITFTMNGKSNNWATHDVGMANAQLLLQAAENDIYGHLMAGFDPVKVKELLQLDENQEPVCMGALGYLGDPEELEEAYKSRELAPRSRREVSEFATKL